MKKLLTITIAIMLMMPGEGLCLRSLSWNNMSFHFSDSLRFRDTEWRLEIDQRPEGLIDIKIINRENGEELTVVENSIFIYDDYDEVELRRLLLETMFFREDRVRRSFAIDWWGKFFETKVYKRHLSCSNEDVAHSTAHNFSFDLLYNGTPFYSVCFSLNTDSGLDMSTTTHMQDGYYDFEYTNLGLHIALNMLNSGKVAEEQEAYRKSNSQREQKLQQGPIMLSIRNYEESRILLHNQLQERGVIAYGFADEKGNMFYFINQPGYSEVITERISDTQAACFYRNTNGMVYISLISNGKGKLIVEGNKSLATTTPGESDMLRNMPFCQRADVKINWQPDHMKDTRDKLRRILDDEEITVAFPERLLQFASALGVNPVDIVKLPLAEHFEPQGEEDKIVERGTDGWRSNRKTNTQWHAEYLKELKDLIIRYYMKQAIGVKDPDLLKSGIGGSDYRSITAESVWERFEEGFWQQDPAVPSISKPHYETDIAGWEDFVGKLWDRNSEEFKAVFGDFLFREDLIARKLQKEKSKTPAVDKGVLDQEIKKELTKESSAQNMWQFLKSVFGRWREDMQIEIITVCNLRCGHCLAMPKMMSLQHRGRQMQKEQLKAIIRSLRGIERICFTGGEPFLYGYIGKAKELREALHSGDGVLSDDFLEILEYAQEMEIKEVLIDTNGFAFPTDDEKAKRFFERIPDNVTFELSLDDEHIGELKRQFDKEMRDVVRACELYAKNDVRYNLRVRPSGSFSREGDIKELLTSCDFEGRVWEKYEEGTDWFDKPKDGALVRTSRAKLQGNAVKDFTSDRSYGNYLGMEITRFVDNFFPTNILFFLGHNGKVFFDAHSGFTPNPPEISCLGDLNQASFAEVMLDGIVGRFIDFETHPYLRYLYLARYFASVGNERLSNQCLAYAQTAGAEYERRYTALTEGVDFSDIVETEYSCLLAQHFRIALIDNLLFGKDIPWLSDIVPVDSGTDIIWDLGSTWGEEKIHPYLLPVLDDLLGIWLYVGAEEKHLICAVIRNYIDKTPRFQESIEACVDLVVETLQSGNYVSDRSPLFQTTEDMGFLFLFFREPLDEFAIPQDEESYNKIFESLVNPFEHNLKCAIEFFLREHSILFYELLSNKLLAYIEQERDDKKIWLAQEYIKLCKKRIERKWQPEDAPVVEGGPDIRAFFIEYVIHRLSENKKYPNMDRGFTRDVVEKVENGALQPDTEDDIATSGSAKPVKTDRGESAILHAA